MHWNAFLADAAAPASTAPATSGTQAASSAAAPPPLFGNPIFFLVIIGVMMYFVLIRPQQQQKKQLAALMASLKSGDKVVTSSGIVGTVITVKDTTVSLRSADTKMEVTKSSIAEIRERGDDTSSSS